MGAGSEVGGDFYDVIADSDGCWLIVGDVCGKGAEAAALTGFVRHTTAAYARETNAARARPHARQPGDARAGLRRLLRDRDPRPACVSAPADVEVTVGAAGHPAALIARADGEAPASSAPRGTLLGVFPDADIEEAPPFMRPGDALALYTDGLTEAHAPHAGAVGRADARAPAQRSPRNRPRTRSTRCSG